MLNKTINKGSLWLGKTWKDAIKLSLTTPDCGIEKLYVDEHPNTLLDDNQVHVGYQIYGYENRKKYHTRIPKTLNEYVDMVMR